MRVIATPRGPVHVWAPTGAARDVAVVYVHGYGDNAATAVRDHRLEEQFQRSGKRATFIVPEAPSSSSQPVYFPDLAALLAEVGMPKSTRVVAIAHSGGYRTVLPWLAQPQLRHVILLDAVYGMSGAAFAAWARGAGHTLDIVGEDTAEASKALATTTSSPYTAATSHMGIVTEGKLIPSLLARAPLPGGAGGAIAAAILAFIGWGAWRLLR